jgi:hypothetical protein
MSAIDFIREKNLVKTVLIDGAAGRITHVGMLADSQFIYCVRADSANFLRVAKNIELIAQLAELPMDNEPQDADDKFLLTGPLTASGIEKIPAKITRISIADLTDCFLDADAFKRVSERFVIEVRRRIPFLGFLVLLKNISQKTFLEAIPSITAKIIFNPFEVGTSACH